MFLAYSLYCVLSPLSFYCRGVLSKITLFTHGCRRPVWPAPSQRVPRVGGTSPAEPSSRLQPRKWDEISRSPSGFFSSALRRLQTRICSVHVIILNCQAYCQQAIHHPAVSGCYVHVSSNKLIAITIIPAIKPPIAK